MKEYTRNHYVPVWYQKRFIPSTEDYNRLYYLDINPEKVKVSPGRYFYRKNIRQGGPKSCFYVDDLYTTIFNGISNTDIEQYFFGEIDNNGIAALDYFSRYDHSVINTAFLDPFIRYMSVQKLRTPKGMLVLEKLLGINDKNKILIKIQELQGIYCAIWIESIWCIADASYSETKFLLSDNPITVYNKGCFPGSKFCKNHGDPEIWLNGTHTIFPLDYNKVLILTNQSWLRNPYGSPIIPRPNPNLFRDSLFSFLPIQVNRKLTEDEVIKINYIIKKRSFKYIASSNKEWLYPEKKLENIRWDSFGNEYLLMPDPRNHSFSTNYYLGHSDGRSESFDAYGRRPTSSDYDKERIEKKEWISFQAYKGEFSRLLGPMRRGISCNSESRRMAIQEDNEATHKYNLSLESKYKGIMRKRR